MQAGSYLSSNTAGARFRLAAEWDGREFRGPGVAAAAQMELHSQGKPGAALGRPRSEDWQNKNSTLSRTLSQTLKKNDPKLEKILGAVS